MQRVRLATPARPRAPEIPARVFDAWAWCESDHLDWVRPRRRRSLPRGRTAPLDNPPELVFLLDERCTFLPREVASLHAPRCAPEGAWALAPWAIDDATDALYATRTRPRDVLELLAPTREALVWGLHDWVHFHNHGPFDEPAWTELQCDLVALSWLRLNADLVPLDDPALARLARELAARSRRRFADEEKTHEIASLDLDALFDARA